MAKRLEERLIALESAQRTANYRPFPLSWFYGEPLPQDFDTNEKYAGPRTRDEWYANFLKNNPMHGVRQAEFL